MQPIDLLPCSLDELRDHLESKGDLTLEALKLLREAEDERRGNKTDDEDNKDVIERSNCQGLVCHLTLAMGKEQMPPRLLVRFEGIPI